MWSLVPLRHGERLNESTVLTLRDNKAIGRDEFIDTTRNACSCREEKNGCCGECNAMCEWAKQFISRQALKICQGYLHVRGRNTRRIVILDGKPVKTFIDDSSHENDKGWTTITEKLQNGMLLTLQYPFPYEERPITPLEFRIVKSENEVEGPDDGSPSSETMLVAHCSIRTAGVSPRALSYGDKDVDVTRDIEEEKPCIESTTDRSSDDNNAKRDAGVGARIDVGVDRSALLESHNGDNGTTTGRDHAEDESLEMMDHESDVRNSKGSSCEQSDTVSDSKPSNCDELKASNESPDASHLQMNDNDTDARMDAHLHEHKSPPAARAEPWSSQSSTPDIKEFMQYIDRDIVAAEKDWPEEESENENNEAESTMPMPEKSPVETDEAPTVSGGVDRDGAQIVSSDEGQQHGVDRAASTTSKAETSVSMKSSTVGSCPLPNTEANAGDTEKTPYNPSTRSKEPPANAEPTIESLFDDSDAEHDAPVSPQQFKLMFVPLGAACSLKKVAILTKVARAKGAEVVLSLENNPTHLILDPHVRAEQVSEELFRTRKLKKLDDYLTKNHVATVKTDWIPGPGSELKPPTIDQLWNGLASYKLKERGQKRKPASSDQLKPRPPPKKIKTFQSNTELSEMFHKLAKLHQECSLELKDEFRALTNNLISGRLRKLDFEITPSNLDDVKKIKGIGESSVNKMAEFFNRRDGKCNKIEEFEKDFQRMAMREMKRIWGVGQSKAELLVSQGYRTIQQVREGIASGALNDFNNNQLIGVKYYEDFLEKMERSEVEQMAGIVKNAVQERYPEADVVIMGSYRRGKPKCGDIDLLITSQRYVKTTPRGALGELVSRLKGRGHIAHHLTPHLEGMTHGSFDSQSSHDCSQEALPPPPGSAADGRQSSASYMGVFCSPVVPGKMRRIDIKFYPYRERVFASLYFTGCGWFNRSMRRWVRRENLSLNDHGLFRAMQNKTTSNALTLSSEPEFKASTEREVFDRLGLVFREPHDRNYFDDVIPKDLTVDWDPGDMTLAELQKDSSSHQHWVD